MKLWVMPERILQIINVTMATLAKCLPPVQWPKTELKWLAIETAFHSMYGISHVLGAVDIRKILVEGKDQRDWCEVSSNYDVRKLSIVITPSERLGS